MSILKNIIACAFPGIFILHSQLLENSSFQSNQDFPRSGSMDSTRKNKTVKTKKEIDIYKLESYFCTEKVSEKLIQKIDFPCAFIIFPTDEQVNTLQSKMSEDDYSILVDDETYYQGTAIGLLDSLDIKTVNATKQFVQFKSDRTWLLDIRKKDFPEWNILLFNKDQAPCVLSTTDSVVFKIKQYFQLK
jgi:hypothetical protein